MKANQVLLALSATCWLLLAVTACVPTPDRYSNAATAEMDRETKMKYAQYMEAGQQLYVQYCMNCHMDQGQGLGELYPPLAKADYLINFKQASICGILYGQEGEIVVNGVTYNQPMPAQAQLTPLEIAEVYTFVSNSWGNAAGLTLVTEVEKLLRDCPDK